MDVGVIIGAMILKNIENVNTKNRLLQVIDMKTFESEIQKLVYDEFGDELEQKDKEIEQKENELEQKDKEIEQKENEISKLTKTNNTYKNKIDQIKEIGDLNSPKAQEIIQSLMLL
jgi:predicted ribosome quality control (RQC) complex YloA/Tae2 family protein